MTERGTDDYILVKIFLPSNGQPEVKLVEMGASRSSYIEFSSDPRVGYRRYKCDSDQPVKFVDPRAPNAEEKALLESETLKISI